MTDSIAAVRINIRRLNFTFKQLQQFCGQQQFEALLLISG
jgi:hypothetical protein